MYLINIKTSKSAFFDIDQKYVHFKLEQQNKYLNELKQNCNHKSVNRQNGNFK